MTVSQASKPVSRKDRMMGAIVGQFVGDALCLGSHWHYDLAKRDALYPGGIVGFEAPIGDHYHKNRLPGDLTHYGDAGLVVLRSVAGLGQFDHRDYGRRFISIFSDPDYPGYVDRAARGTIENAKGAGGLTPGSNFDFQRGADDFQTITISRLAPIAVRHAGGSDYLAIIERATRVCQDNDEAVACTIAHGLILKTLFDGGSLAEAIESACSSGEGEWGEPIARYLKEAKQMIDQSVVDATGEFGRACYLKSTFPSCLHAALRHGDDPAACLMGIVRAGGDNASRASVAGAWMGAAHGLSGLPQDWVDRLNHGHEILELSKQVTDAALSSKKETPL